MKAIYTFLLLSLVPGVIFAAQPTGRYALAIEKMKELNKQHPDISQLINLGKNDEGVDIIGMRVSTTPRVIDNRKIGQLVVATHHGNEGKSTTLALYFLARLLRRFESGQLYTHNLGAMEWTIIPVLNVSGFNANSRHEHGVDPNRDYPGPCTSSPGGRLASVRSLMNLLKVRTFAGAVTIHGYIGTLTFPWGVSTDNTHTHDHNFYASVVGKAAQLNGYRSGTSTDLIYSATGTFEDYVYWKHGSWSLLVELATGNSGDIEATAKSVEYFFNGIDSSPSTKNQLTGSCTRQHRRPDLGIE